VHDPAVALRVSPKRNVLVERGPPQGPQATGVCIVLALDAVHFLGDSIVAEVTVALVKQASPSALNLGLAEVLL